MTDRILEIGQAGLESTDQKVRKMMESIVNSQVPGFKESGVIVRGFPLELEAAQQKLDPVKPQVEGSYISDVQGALIKTNSPLDLALAGDGYFVIAGPWGDGYTRDGRFQLDRDGRLVTIAGNYPVMGKSGPIVVTPGAEVEFTQSGEIKVDKVVIDQLQVVVPEGKSVLETLNGAIFKRKDPYSVLQEVEVPRVIQGYIESSNVNEVEKMMEMILLERTYNFDTKLVSNRDAMLSRAMELGKPTQ
ncbi:MAG: flagellar hook basal-body protein [bacterium]